MWMISARSPSSMLQRRRSLRSWLDRKLFYLLSLFISFPIYFPHFILHPYDLWYTLGIYYREITLVAVTFSIQCNFPNQTLTTFYFSFIVTRSFSPTWSLRRLPSSSRMTAAVGSSTPWRPFAFSRPMARVCERVNLSTASLLTVPSPCKVMSFAKSYWMICKLLFVCFCPL